MVVMLLKFQITSFSSPGGLSVPRVTRRLNIESRAETFPEGSQTVEDCSWHTGVGVVRGKGVVLGG